MLCFRSMLTRKAGGASMPPFLGHRRTVPRFPMPAETPNLAVRRDLCVYQDVMDEDRTAVRGVRDCQGRWDAIEPHLPPLGTVLDVGSNFGWFALAACRHAPRAVVASVEADLRSAQVQRAALVTQKHRRVALLLHPAGRRMARLVARHAQRIDAVFCLSVLHWIRDHRAMLELLAPWCGRIFVEHPDPREEGAGSRRLRHEIGPIGPYLAGLFPGRRVRQLAEWPSHRDSVYPRELWLVEEPPGWTEQPAAGFDPALLMKLDLSWPPRSWWQEQMYRDAAGDRHALLYTADGLIREACRPQDRAALRREVGRLPEHQLLSRRQRLARAARRIALRVWGGVR